MFLAIEDNVLLYVKGTAGQDNTKSVDNYDDQQLEKLEKITLTELKCWMKTSG